MALCRSHPFPEVDHPNLPGLFLSQLYPYSFPVRLFLLSLCRLGLFSVQCSVVAIFVRYRPRCLYVFGISLLLCVFALYRNWIPGCFHYTCLFVFFFCPVRRGLLGTFTVDRNGFLGVGYDFRHTHAIIISTSIMSRIFRRLLKYELAFYLRYLPGLS